MFLAPRLVWVTVWLALPAAFGLLGPVAAVILVLLLLTLLVLSDWKMAPQAGTLQLSMEVPEVGSVGQELAVPMRLHNPGRRRLKAGIHLQAPASLGRSPARAQVEVAPGNWTELSWSLRPQVRGIALVGPATVRTLGPMGLAGRQTALPPEHRIKVYPELPGRRQAALRLNRALFLRSGIRAAASRGEGTEFDSMRPYHPDDEFRRINWQATARANEPIANTFRQERNQRVLVLVDAGRTMATSIGPYTRFEYAMDSCVALAELAGQMGDHVGMIAFGSSPLAVVPPKSGKVHARRILDQLFQLQPSLDASNYRRAFSVLLAQFSRRALLVLLTELTEPEAMETLFQAMPALVKRHLVIVASMTDPFLTGVLATSPGDSQGAYLKAAAEASILGRERSAFALRAMGAVVVDTNPEELPGRLADEYLRLKAFGRL